MSWGVSITRKPSDVDRRVISPVRNGTDTGVPLTCEDKEDVNVYISKTGCTGTCTDKNVSLFPIKLLGFQVFLT